MKIKQYWTNIDQDILNDPKWAKQSDKLRNSRNAYDWAQYFRNKKENVRQKFNTARNWAFGIGAVPAGLLTFVVVVAIGLGRRDGYPVTFSEVQFALQLIGYFMAPAALIELVKRISNLRFNLNIANLDNIATLYIEYRKDFAKTYDNIPRKDKAKIKAAREKIYKIIASEQAQKTGELDAAQAKEIVALAKDKDIVKIALESITSGKDNISGSPKNVIKALNKIIERVK